ncbi:MAG TPA: hypothetical protein VLU96_03295 [Gaiellaceae bacterium]|nr:hypothetical protein [Gaiellaceae bacterium]
MIFFFVTAPFLICEVPTLFFGSSALLAAYVVPLSARKSANSAIVFLRRKRVNLLVIDPSFL